MHCKTQNCAAKKIKIHGTRILFHSLSTNLSVLSTTPLFSPALTAALCILSTMNCATCRLPFTQWVYTICTRNHPWSEHCQNYNHHKSSSLHSPLYFTTILLYQEISGLKLTYSRNCASLILSKSNFEEGTITTKQVYILQSFPTQFFHWCTFIILTAVLWRRAAVSLYLSLGMEQCCRMASSSFMWFTRTAKCQCRGRGTSDRISDTTYITSASGTSLGWVGAAGRGEIGGRKGKEEALKERVQERVNFSRVSLCIISQIYPGSEHTFCYIVVQLQTTRC